MNTQNQWGKQLRIFRLAGGYKSQGAWVTAASSLMTSLPPLEVGELLSETTSSDIDAFDISQTMLSRWETGARKPPRERSRHLFLIWTLVQLHCIQSPSEADDWLALADLKPLTLAERIEVGPQWIETHWTEAEQVGNYSSADPSSEGHQHEIIDEISAPPNVGAIEDTTQLHVRTTVRVNDWGEAPEMSIFYGRTAEQELLRAWLKRKQTRLIGVWGMGGQGKTALVAKISRECAGNFEGVIWRSLLNAPLLDEILVAWILGFSNKRLFELPAGLDERLSMLFELLRSRRYLLILDNVESILEMSDSLGRYRPGYESYANLFLRFGETLHQSCLLLTSREEPREFTRLRSSLGSSSDLSLETLTLGGLDTAASRDLMMANIPDGSSSGLLKLAHQYSGHPLALMLISRAIIEFYGGDISLYLSESSGFFGDIQELLSQHFHRVTAAERSILFWLTIEREPITTKSLRDNLILPIEQSQLVASLRSLQRRSLIEIRPGTQGRMARLALQNVVIEYLTEQIVQAACADFKLKSLNLNPETENREQSVDSFLHQYALFKATSKSYVRQSQERLLLRPIAENLLASIGRRSLRSNIIQRLTQLRERGLEVGYTAGNCLNLLIYIREDLQGLDLSHLPVWQVALEDKVLRRANLAYADLSTSVIYERFGRALSLQFHPEGGVLFAGTSHGQVDVYRIADLHPVDKHTGPIQLISSMDISTDGKLLVSSGMDGVVHVWDTYKNSEESAAEIDPDDREDVDLYLRHRHQFDAGERARALSICANRIVAVGCMNTIRLWDIEDERFVATADAHQGAVQTMAYSADAGLLASGGEDKRVLLWRIDDSSLKSFAMLPQSHSVWSIAINPKGTQLAAGCRNGKIFLWELDAIEQMSNGGSRLFAGPLLVCIGHTSRVNALSYGVGGQTLASASGDKTIRVWDVASGQTVHLLQGCRADVETVQFSPDGTILASGSNDRMIRLWDAASGKELRSLGSFTDGAMTAIDFSPDGRFLVSGGGDGTVRIWELAKPMVQHSVREQTNYIFSVAFSPDSSSFASASLDESVCIWATDTHSLIHKLRGHAGEVTSVVYHPHLPLLATSSNDRTVRLWNIHTGTLVHTWDKLASSIWGLAFGSDGQILAASSSLGKIYVWDFETKECIHELSHHQDVAWTVAISPNNRFMASAGYEGTICIRNLEEDSIVHSDLSHAGRVRSVSFSPDSKWLVSAGDDQKIRLWNVETGQALFEQPGKDSVAFHPSGQFFATGEEPWLLQLCDVDTGKRIGRLQAEGPFYGTNITGIRGISSVQKETLKLMGAVENGE